MKNGELCYSNWFVFSTSLNNMEVNWDDYSQYMEEKQDGATNPNASHV